jgi:hypothetical protein
VEVGTNRSDIKDIGDACLSSGMAIKSRREGKVSIHWTLKKENLCLSSDPYMLHWVSDLVIEGRLGV